MTQINKFWNDSTIRIRKEDRYVCLTDMAQASGKFLADWLRLKSTEEYLEELSAVMGIPITELIQVQQGGVPEKQGTWGHPKVSLRFAQWCSAQLAVQVDCWIDELLTTGSVSLHPTQQPKLPANKVALEISRDIREITDNLLDNPRLAQFLIDHAISDIMPSQSLLTGDNLKGVVEIAEEMGFPVNFKNRSQLGKFVKKLCGNLAKSEPRLVNGTMREVACYPANNEDVRQAISDFFTK